MAIGGAGILRLSEHVVARSIHEGLLQLLLQDAQDPEIYPLYALLPPGRHQPPKVKVFIDFLASAWFCTLADRFHRAESGAIC